MNHSENTLLRAMNRLSAALGRFVKLCETADNRAMAVDGSVDPTWKHVYPKDLRDAYRRGVSALKYFNLTMSKNP